MGAGSRRDSHEVLPSARGRRVPGVVHSVVVVEVALGLVRHQAKDADV
jgi:hypothetical protein